MYKIVNFTKTKILVPSIVALLAISAFASGNLNYYGQLGVHKTQSAQTLGHGSFGIGLFVEGTRLNIIEDDVIYYESLGQNKVDLGQYIGLNVYPFLSVGITDYLDFGISAPIYGDIMKTVPNDNKCFEANVCKEWMPGGGWGDMRLMAKGRAPFDELPIDLALILGLGIHFSSADEYGLWVRNPSYIRKKDNVVLIAHDDGATAYTNGSHIFNFGIAFTFDFSKLRAEAPLLWHLNYGYRMTLGDRGSEYPSVQSISTAIEWTPTHFISLFSEYYVDIPNKDYPIEDYFGLSTVTLGTSLHLTETFDLQIGVQFAPGQNEDYVKNLNRNYGTEGDNKNVYYNATLMPTVMPYIGFNVKLFTKEEVEEEAVPPVVSFSASQETIQKGQSITLKWSTTYANEVSIDGLGIVPARGSRKVTPSENTTYTIIARGEGGTKKIETIDITVNESEEPPPTVAFSADAETVQKGQPVTLTWEVTDAVDVSIDGIGIVPASGSRKVTPSENTTYTIIARGEGGAKTIETVDVVVEEPEEVVVLPTAVLSASPEAIQKGQSATLTWMTTDATEVSIEGIGIVPARGTRKVSPSETTTYTIIAKGKGGSQAIETAEVTIEEPKIEAKVNLKGVNFVSGKAELTLNARQVLDGVAEQLLEPRNVNVKIEIHGHTDNQGNPKSNQDLSERRAKAVIGYLATKGVKVSRMKAAGFGQDVPIADNKTAAGREQNRRIEMIRVDD